MGLARGGWWASIAGMLLCPRPVSAACEGTTTLAGLEAALDEAWNAQNDVDDERFAAAVDAAIEQVGCLGDALTPSAAAEFHSVMTLEAFGRQDTGAALNSIRAAYAADPENALPDRLPPHHPLRSQYELAQELPKAFQLVPVREAPRQWVSADGSRTDQVPVDRPVLLQLRTDDGAVVDTVYLRLGESLPDWAQMPPPLPEPVLPPPAPVTEPRPWWPFAVAGGASAAITATGAVLFFDALSAYKREDVSNSPELKGWYESSLLPRYNAGIALMSVGAAAGATTAVVALWPRGEVVVGVTPAPTGISVVVAVPTPR